MTRFALVALFLPSLANADRVAPPAAGDVGGPAIPNAGAPMTRRAPMHEAPAVVAPMPMRRPQPPPVPVVPIEIAKQGKAIAGTYRCKGNQQTGTGASTPLEATLVIKLDLDNAWINASWVSKAMRLADFRTYDATSQQWTRIQLGNDTSHGSFVSLGEKGGEWVWEGPEVTPTGTVTQRHHEQLSGKDLTLWGEAQLGGQWQKLYQLACKR